MQEQELIQEQKTSRAADADFEEPESTDVDQWPISLLQERGQQSTNCHKFERYLIPISNLKLVEERGGAHVQAATLAAEGVQNKQPEGEVNDAPPDGRQPAMRKGARLNEDRFVAEVFPRNMRVSINFGQINVDYCVPTNRLPNSECQLLFVKGDEILCLFLTLPEAETIKFAMEENPGAFEESGATLLHCRPLDAKMKTRDWESKGANTHTSVEDEVTYKWEVNLLSRNRLEKKLEGGKPRWRGDLAKALCLTKVFDSFHFFNDIEISLLFQQFCSGFDLESVSDKKEILDVRSSLHNCLVRSRHRSVSEMAPIQRILRNVNDKEFTRKVQSAKLVRDVLQSMGKSSDEDILSMFAEFDASGNNSLDRGELTQILEKLLPKDLDQRVDQTQVINDTIDLMGSAKTLEISFRQFCAFFFDKSNVQTKPRVQHVLDDAKSGRDKATKRRARKKNMQRETSTGNAHSSTKGDFREAAATKLKRALVIVKAATRFNMAAVKVPPHLLMRNTASIGRFVP